MEFLNIEALTKSFGREVVLDNVTFSVPKGEILVLFGKSGAGKTVLLRCIAGVVEPDSGVISIGGTDFTKVQPEYRDIGMAFQNFALFPHMTAFENISSSLTSKHFSTNEIESKVSAVSKLLKIDHVLTHLPKALSNGQKQRTALARALVSEPQILLLDDPLRNVDAKLRFEMRLELPRLLADRGATVIYVTQDYKEAMALSDKIIVLDEGKIVQNGTPEDIYNYPANTNIARLFGDPTINLLDILPQQDKNGLFFELSDQRIPIDNDYSNVIDQNCKVGLRPESLSFAESNGIPVTVEAVTPFNEKCVTLVVTRRGREILLSQPVQNKSPDSVDTFINIDSNKINLFDSATGLRIEPNTNSANTKS